MWNPTVWKHSRIRFICRTTGDRWVMALLDPSPCLRQRHVAYAVGDREEAMHAACLIGSVPGIPLLERLSLEFEDVRDVEWLNGDGGAWRGISITFRLSRRSGSSSRDGPDSEGELVCAKRYKQTGGEETVI